MNTNLLILLYLGAVILANIIISIFGIQAAIPVGFFLIGLDLSSRDSLHDRWKHQHLFLRMILLIGSGSILTAVLNINAGQIALASFFAFLSAGMSDMVIYSLLGERTRLIRMNGSNLISAAVDTILFQAIAFGFPLSIPILLMQYVAKVFGGFFWSLILTRTERSDDELPHVYASGSARDL
jgi:hypothetical protein